MDAGRTVAWSSKHLLGKEEHVRSLFEASIDLTPNHYSENNSSGQVSLFYQISNNSDLYFELELKEGNGTKLIILHPRSSQIISAPEGTKLLTYEVVTTYIRSDKHLIVDLNLPQKIN